MIEIRRTGEGEPLEFEVVVREVQSETHHPRHDDQRDLRSTAGKHTPERCLEAAFRVLLDREPKKSNLSRFDVTVISRYFPGFEQELPRYLSPGLTRGKVQPLKAPILPRSRPWRRTSAKGLRLAETLGNRRLDG